MKITKLVSKLMLFASICFIFSVSVQAQSGTVLSTYLDIKDALVESNSKNASLAANEMVSIMKGKTDELSKKLIEDTKAISVSSDIKMQRKYFDVLSQNVYDYVKKRGQKTYLQTG